MRFSGYFVFLYDPRPTWVKWEHAIKHATFIQTVSVSLLRNIHAGLKVYFGEQGSAAFEAIICSTSLCHYFKLEPILRNQEQNQ